MVCKKGGDYFIVKPFHMPISVFAQKALERRLPDSHPKKQTIKEDLQKQLAGHRGEKEIYRYIKRLPVEEYIHFHGLRLPDGHNEYFQMDFLIAAGSFLLIIEVKNYAGELILERPYPQLLQTKKGVVTAFQDPVLQVNRQRDHLIRWLDLHRLPSLPVEALVLNANPTAIIKAAAGHASLFQTFIHPDNLLAKIQQLKEQHTAERISRKTLWKLATHLLQSHVPLYPNLLAKYQLPVSALYTGCHCSQCGMLPIERNHGRWTCPACGTASKHAHIAALADYLFLIKNTITNRELRNYLSLDCDMAAYRLLKSLDLPSTGITKSKTYQLTPLAEFFK